MGRKKKKIRVSVTGATGFLGGNILRALMARPDMAPIAAAIKGGPI